MDSIVLKIFLLCILLSSCFTDKSQLQYDGKVIIVYTDSSVNEPAIALNKKNNNNIFISCNSDNKNFFVSNDGGKTWNISRLECRYGIGPDPFLTSSRNGDVFYMHMSGKGDGIVCRTNIKNNQFNEGGFVGKNDLKCQERPAACFDDEMNILHIVWTEYDVYGSDKQGDSTRVWYTQSYDRGKTFVNTQVISKIQGDCLDKDGSLMGATICKIKDSIICASWASMEGIMFTISYDYGKHWMQEKNICKIINGYDYYLKNISMPEGLPNMKSDKNGNIYINFCMQLDDGTSNTYILKSKDGGVSWSIPDKIIKNNQVLHIFTSWMSVDELSGEIHVINYSLNPDINEICVWLNKSIDGGKNFSNTVIDKFINTQKDLFVGDYIMIDSYNNTTVAAWTSLTNEKRTIKCYTYYKR